MTQGSSTRTRWFARVLGFGNVAGTPDEVLTFLQRRVTLYVGLISAFWLGAWVLNAVIGATRGALIPVSGVERTLSGAHLSFALLAGILWLVTRKRMRSLPVLGTLDATLTVGQGLMLGAMVALLDRALVSEASAMLALSHVLAARAAVVPSRGARSAIVGALACLPVIVGTVIQASGTVGHQAALMPWQTTLTTVLWCGVAVLATSVISFVIYGLQQRAQAAQQLGQYTLEEKIGQGGMGVVYRARHALLRRPTAVKLLAPDRDGGTALARFEREVQLTSRLTHPNTIAIFDYGRTPDGIFYYAMEYLDGLDLETLVKAEGQQPAGRVIHILRQAAGALAEAHHVGLIHRDVKPANLLLCRRGLLFDFVKVLDFGLVRRMDDDDGLSKTNMLLGTPLYMSPESIQSSEGIDGRTDLYALGSVGYFLLTGRPPFDGDNVLDVCRQHLHAVPVPPSEIARDVPRELEALILACLAKAPGDRPQDAQCLQRDLDACQQTTAWTEEQAAAWWGQRGDALRERRKSRLPSVQSASTLAVDLGNRMRASER